MDGIHQMILGQLGSRIQSGRTLLVEFFNPHLKGGKAGVTPPGNHSNGASTPQKAAHLQQSADRLRQVEEHKQHDSDIKATRQKRELGGIGMYSSKSLRCPFEHAFSVIYTNYKSEGSRLL